jgi:hypothetical protein
MSDQTPVNPQLEGFKDLALHLSYPDSWEEISEDRPRWNWDDLRERWLLTCHHSQEIASYYCEQYPLLAQYPLLYLDGGEEKKL